MTLLEQMKNYAGVLTEDATPQQIGRKIEAELNNDASQQEINKKLDVLIGKSWLKVTPVQGTTYVSIHPMNYDDSQGNIDKLVASFCINSANQEKVRNAFRTWIGTAMANIKSKYPNVVFSNRKQDNKETA